jgi:hypothetical protein
VHEALHPLIAERAVERGSRLPAAYESGRRPEQRAGGGRAGERARLQRIGDQTGLLRLARSEMAGITGAGRLVLGNKHTAHARLPASRSAAQLGEHRAVVRAELPLRG